MPINIDLNITPPYSYSDEECCQLSNAIDLNKEQEHSVDIQLEADFLDINEIEGGSNRETDEGNFEVVVESDPTANILGNTSEEPIHGRGSHRTFLNNDQRASISRMLLQSTCNGKLKKHTIKTVASLYSVSRSVIQRIWQKTRQEGDASHKKTKNCGRKRVELHPTRFREVPLSNRTTYRSLACAININKTSLIRLKKNGAIRRHSNAIKPFLKEENKVAPLKFCISMLEMGSIPHDPTFQTMHNIIQIDEKWFYMTKRSVNYYLLPDEEKPLRTCKSKNYIGKVMFLVAVARPRFDAEGNEFFSGKIGVFPFITYEAAKRSSINRAAGTLETKPITSVNKEVSRQFLITKFLPAIKAKWSRDDLRDPIFIQQDNARSHINHNDAEFCQEATKDGFDIRLMCQPPNSPDLNVLDLGFFSAIQSLQHKEAPKTVGDLVGAVVRAFESYSSFECNKIFLTLQSFMVEIMKGKGSNNYKIPHIKKAVMQREGRLPAQLKCDPSLVEEVVAYLRDDIQM